MFVRAAARNGLGMAVMPAAVRYADVRVVCCSSAGSHPPADVVSGVRGLTSVGG